MKWLASIGGESLGQYTTFGGSVGLPASDIVIATHVMYKVLNTQTPRNMEQNGWRPNRYFDSLQYAGIENIISSNVLKRHYPFAVTISSSPFALLLQNAVAKSVFDG